MFNLINNFIEKYNDLPSKEAIAVELANSSDIDEKLFEECRDELATLEISTDTNFDWLVNETEEFVKRRAMYLAITKAVQIYDDKDGKEQIGAIPQLMTDALSISFDQHIGHDYLEEPEFRYDFYHRTEEKIPFHINKLDKITKGGIANKTLTVFILGTGKGKSLLMTNFASQNLLDGKNVLYITLEMSEERIAERIDARLLDINLNDLELIPKEIFINKVNFIKERTPGKIIIKEYPTSSVGAANFRALLLDLKLKKNFVPHIIYIDYLNICISSRLRMNRGATMYEYVKAVAEEIRGLATEFNLPVVTGAQLNRKGFASDDPGLDDTSESFGLTFHGDLILGGVSNEELEREGKIMFTQLKNRYNDTNYYKHFLVGIDRSKMKLYDLDDYEEERQDSGVIQSITSKSTSSLFKDFS